MKKALKITGFILLGAIAVITIGAAVIAMRGIPSYEAKVPQLKVEVTPERVEKGVKLAGMLCKSCHFSSETGKFTGEYMSDAPAEFGQIFSKNITQDPEYGIGKWTDGELAYLIRTGIKPDGQYLPPYMVKLAHISDEDLYSIIAFLRSNHEWVQPSSTEPPASQPSFLTKLLCNLVFKPLPYPEKVIMAPDTNNKVAWGQYIATGQLECHTCHSADFKTNDYAAPEKSIGFFGGGNPLLNRKGEVIKSANITSDANTGIGKWTKEQFMNAVRFGQRPDGKALRYPMLPYAQLTESEAGAIYEYLKTVPTLNNTVDRHFQ